MDEQMEVRFPDGKRKVPAYFKLDHPMFSGGDGFATPSFVHGRLTPKPIDGWVFYFDGIQWCAYEDRG